MDYESMSVHELQKLVRERRLLEAVSSRPGVLVLNMKKGELIALLRDGTMPEAITSTGAGTTSTTSTTSTSTGGALDGLLEVIVQEVMRRTASGTSASEQSVEMLRVHVRENHELVLANIEELARKIDAIHKPNVIHVRTDAGETRAIAGVQHMHFARLLQYAQARDSDGYVPPIYLTGPAGTGKTTAARRLAEALGLPFYHNGAIDTEYKLSGFIDAQGVFRSRPFFEAYVGGGVYLFDELDASLPGAVLAFNGAIANHHADFPCGSRERNRNSILLGSGNTAMLGDGAGAGYQRMEHDKSFRDRFVFLPWPIDERLEASLVPEAHATWLAAVRRARTNVIKHGIKKAEVTPRATFFGMALLDAGVPREQVIEATLRKGLPDDTWKLVGEGVC